MSRVSQRHAHPMRLRDVPRQRSHAIRASQHAATGAQDPAAPAVPALPIRPEQPTWPALIIDELSAQLGHRRWRAASWPFRSDRHWRYRWVHCAEADPK